MMTICGISGKREFIGNYNTYYEGVSYCPYDPGTDAYDEWWIMWEDNLEEGDCW